jgi:hypothetical protein
VGKWSAPPTGACTLTRVETADDLNGHRIHSPGEVQVVDDQDRPAPAGELGRLRIRTSHVDGHVGDPGATGAFHMGKINRAALKALLPPHRP